MIFIVTNLFSQKDGAVLLQIAMCILYFNGVVEYAQIQILLAREIKLNPVSHRVVSLDVITTI